MGSKNRIHLGFITSYILHFNRNFFNSSKIYMSKRVQMKIKEKHNDVFTFTSCVSFDFLLQSTFGSIVYKNDEAIINFISYLNCDDRFILYSLKREKHHISCTTIFSLRPQTLKKYVKDKKFVLYKSNMREIIERYITN